MSDLISKEELMSLPKVIIRDHFGGVGQICIDMRDIDSLPPVTIAENATVEDCISRQAAIDAMQKLIIADDEEGLMLMENNQAVNNCIVTVMELPPVEQKQEGMTVEEYRQRMMDAFHNADCGELIALVVLPSEKEFEHLEWLLEKHYKAKPEPKQGEWKRVSMDKYVRHAMAFYRCSKCGDDTIGISNYCPNCGAKMEVGDENSN